MSISQQFGYPSYPTPGSPLSTAQLLPPASSSTSSSPTMSSPCCENGRSLINPHTGQTVCSCQYPAGLLTYSRVGLPEPVYPATPYSTPQGYMPLGTDPSAFYPPLNSPYELKEAGETWRGIGQPPSCYPYDPTSMPPYPYPNTYGGMDINSAARRKNATRENTNTLKAWLYEHRKNPYPTKGEKIMLAIITKMTLTQVSTWFANARRRLKKENKMTWSPRNKPGDNDDDDDDDSKDKTENADSDDENSGEKSPKDEKKSCDREGQLADDVTDESSPSSSMRTVRTYDTPPDSSHMSRPHLLGQSHLHDPSLTRRPPNFAPPQMPPETPPTFLNLPPSSHGYNPAGPSGPIVSPNGNMASAGNMNSVMESASGSTLKRPDSLCSNSNDSGLSDVNCGYPDGVQNTMDGLRPKIWSLAHVATSDPGYMNHNSSTTSNGSTNNILPRNMSTYGRGSLGPMQGPGAMPHGLMNSNMATGHLGQEGLQPTSSPITSLSSLTPSSSSSMPPLPGGMSQWGPMYGGQSTLGSPFGKPPGQGPLFPQSLSGMHPGGQMTPLNSLPGLQPTSPTPAYNQNMTPSTGYYPSSKMVME